MKICDLYQNRFTRFFYKTTEKPILCSMDWCGRHNGLTVLLLLLIGMGLRLGYRGIVDRPERDEITYISWMEKLVASDNGVQLEISSALSYVGLMVSRLGGDTEIGVRCFNLCCSFLSLYMMYLLGKTVFSSQKAGLVSLMLLVFNPYVIRQSGQVMQEPLYLLVFSCGLFCAIQIVRGGGVLRYTALLAPLTVLGCWCRYEGGEMLILLPLAVCFRGMTMLRSKVKHPREWYRLGMGILLYLFMLVAAVTTLYHFSPNYFQNLQRKAAEISKHSFFSR